MSALIFTALAGALVFFYRQARAFARDISQLARFCRERTF